MPLDDREQRILEEIERQFYEDDPKLAETVRTASLASASGRHLKWAVLGLGGEGLSPADSPGQLGLEPRPWSELETAVDRVRDRFGSDAVAPARLVGRRSGLPGALPE